MAFLYVGARIGSSFTWRNWAPYLFRSNVMSFCDMQGPLGFNGSRGENDVFRGVSNFWDFNYRKIHRNL